MTLKELCILTDTALEYQLTNTPSQKVCVSIKHGEIKKGMILIDASAFGNTVHAAERKLAYRLRNTRLVIDAFGRTRREFTIPKTLVSK